MTTTGTGFCKPFGKELLGEARTVQYIYPREELVSEPIFPYFVLDGGAFNFAADRFGTVNGDELLELTTSGKLFDVFQTDGKFNWEASFSFNDGGNGFRKLYEWQIWPQRLYMILPLAHAFLKTGDRRYADQWLRIVRKWEEDHPYQPFVAGVPYIETDMVWRDMQVAWRSLSLMHSVFMLQDAPFSREEWDRIYRFVRLHADHLALEAEDRIRRGIQQNHVLQIGAALVMAGALFPEFPNAGKYLQLGLDTVRMNTGAVFADGGSDEDSPSYNHFIARLYLECYLLLRNNGLPCPDGFCDFVKRQYLWLWNCATPKGQAPRFSDSYAIDAEADLARVSRLLPLDLPAERGNLFYPDSGMAILREHGFSLILDAMDCRAGHRHHGRPQPLLFRGTEAILDDTGCCNYDIWDFYYYVRSAAAHNVVFCPDFDSEETEVHPRVTRFDPDAGVVETETRVSFRERGFVWTRRITVGEGRVTVTDRAASETPLRFCSHFHLTRRPVSVRSENCVTALLPRELLTVTSEMPFSLLFSPVMNDENRKDFARTLHSEVTGTEFCNETTFSFTDR